MSSSRSNSSDLFGLLIAGALVGGVIYFVTKGAAASSTSTSTTTTQQPTTTTTGNPFTTTSTLPNTTTTTTTTRQPTTTTTTTTTTTVPPSGTFSLATLITGLTGPNATVPVKMAFIPGLEPDTAGTGTLFVTTRGGQVHVINSNFGTNFVRQPTTFSSTFPGGIIPNVAVLGDEGGLLGVAFPPDFSTSGWVYFFRTTTGTNQNNVIRVKAVTDGQGNIVADPTSLQVVLTGIAGGTNHNAGHLEFDNLGNLYISTGDSQNGANSQSLTSLNGKILRIHPVDTPVNGLLYTIPTGNPFAGGGGRGEIWCWGLRNPFSFNLEPHIGRLFINDVGLNTWEEINEGTTPANFGWPIIEGPLSASNNAGKTPPANYRDPVYAYPHVPNAPGTPGGFYAITGAQWYHSHQAVYPFSMEGTYFFGDYTQNWLRYLSTPIYSGVQTAIGNIPYPAVVDIRLYSSKIYVLTLAGNFIELRYTP